MFQRWKMRIFTYFMSWMIFFFGLLFSFTAFHKIRNKQPTLALWSATWIWSRNLPHRGVNQFWSNTRGARYSHQIQRFNPPLHGSTSTEKNWWVLHSGLHVLQRLCTSCLHHVLERARGTCLNYTSSMSPATRGSGWSFCLYFVPMTRSWNGSNSMPACSYLSVCMLYAHVQHRILPQPILTITQRFYRKSVVQPLQESFSIGYNEITCPLLAHATSVFPVLNSPITFPQPGKQVRLHTLWDPVEIKKTTSCNTFGIIAHFDYQTPLESIRSIRLDF